MTTSSEREIFDFISKEIALDYLAKRPILNSIGETVGFDCHIVTKSAEVVASGTGKTWILAKRIAISEILERLGAKAAWFESGLEDRYLLKKVPSSSGFAAGFDEGQVRKRAIAEGVERWAWSQWIDFQHHIPEVQVHCSDLSALAQHQLSLFDNVRFFSKRLSIWIDSETLELSLGIVLGEKGGGVFAGSRVTSIRSDFWTHGLTEAARNLGNFSIWSSRDELEMTTDWYSNRVKFFGRNKDEAFKAIKHALSQDWPEPNVEILTPIPTALPGRYFIWRCLLKNFIPWHEGPVSRFVY